MKPTRLPVIDIERLRDSAGELASGFHTAHIHGRTQWLMVQILMDHDFLQREIAYMLDVSRNTVQYYESKRQPWPGEIELLYILRKEFPL